MTMHEPDLVQRLLFHARRMEREGHLNAARYMNYAADEIAFLRYKIMLLKTNKSTKQHTRHHLSDEQVAFLANAANSASRTPAAAASERPFFECPDCGKDIALDTPHAPACSRSQPESDNQ